MAGNILFSPWAPSCPAFSSVPKVRSIAVNHFSKGHHLEVYFSLSNSTKIIFRVQNPLLYPSLLKINVETPSFWPASSQHMCTGKLYHHKVCSWLWRAHNKFLYIMHYSSLPGPWAELGKPMEMDSARYLLGGQHQAQYRTWGLCESICPTQRSSGGTKAHPQALLTTVQSAKHISSQIVFSPSHVCQTTKITQQATPALAFFLCPNVLRWIQCHDGGLKFQQLNEFVKFCFTALTVHEDFNLRTSSPGSPGFNMNHVDMFFLWKH